ncbi:MAG: ABC transporter ATP-binding protein, partial [Planctomycetota bacterium]|nr:ABC transporter ATP-binding protein [Planctomycetota bacterium]
MIDATDLTKCFGPLVAVNGLSFEIGRGEVVGLLGPNGAGKTTTLRMLTGYLPPSRGAVTIAGLDVLRSSLEVRRRIGYLPESVPLYGELRVGEMLEFHGQLHRMDRSRRRERSAFVLERVGLTERRTQRIDNLSKGLRQRVGLAVALLADPELLILDEPTSGLDPLQRMEVRDLIRELARERTVLVSSHILPEVEAVCDRVLILHRGRLAADGRPADLVRELGGTGHLSLTAELGPDTGQAAELLRKLPGVASLKVVDASQAANAGEEPINHPSLRSFELTGEGE